MAKRVSLAEFTRNCFLPAKAEDRESRSDNTYAIAIWEAVGKARQSGGGLVDDLTQLDDPPHAYASVLGPDDVIRAPSGASLEPAE